MTLPARKKPQRSGIEREASPLRSARHLKWLRGFCCCVCGDDQQIEAAHIRIGTDGGIGIKPSDAWAVPLDSGCHARQHRIGEKTFWAGYGKDPHKLAMEFAAKSPDADVREFSRTMRSEFDPQDRRG